MAITGFTFGQGALNAAATTWNGTIPAGTAVGAVLLVLASENTGTATFSISGGGTGVTWTKLSGEDYNSTVLGTDVWIATATASSAGATVTISTTTGGRFIGAGAVVPGFVTTGAVIANTLQSAASTSMPFPSVTVPNANGWQLIGLAAIRVTATPGATLTAPTGTTKIVETASAYGSSAEMTDPIVANNSTVGSGSQTPGTGTASVSAATANLYTVALAPASAAASTFGGLITLAGAPAATTPASATSGQITLGGAPSAKAAASSTTGVITLGGTPTAISTSGGGITLGGAPAAQARASLAGGLITLGGLATPSPVAALLAGLITLSGSSTPRAPASLLAGLITLGGAPAVTFRFSYWNGTGWQQITPRVWNGSAWVAIPVTLLPLDN